MKNQVILESIIFLVNEQIDLVLKEALGDPPTVVPDTPPVDDAAPTDASGPESAGAESIGASTGSGGGGSAPPMDSETPMGDAGGGPSGGMGDFSGNFGGGGGGAGGGMGDEGEGMDAEGGELPEPEEAQANPFQNAETMDDRLQVILDSAEEIANTTQDPQKVFKHVKGLIQNGFSEPEKAARVISDLFNTENPTLQQVSKRLALFTFGV